MSRSEDVDWREMAVDPGGDAPASPTGSPGRAGTERQRRKALPGGRSRRTRLRHPERRLRRSATGSQRVGGSADRADLCFLQFRSASGPADPETRSDPKPSGGAGGEPLPPASGGSCGRGEVAGNRAAAAVMLPRQLTARRFPGAVLAERRTLIPGRRRPSIPAGRASVPMESRGRAWGVSPGLSGEAEPANPSSVPRPRA